MISNRVNDKYIAYLLEELPQLENITNEEIQEEFLPWSDELRDEIRNYERTYKTLKVEEQI